MAGDVFVKRKKTDTMTEAKAKTFVLNRYGIAASDLEAAHTGVNWRWRVKTDAARRKVKAKNRETAAHGGLIGGASAGGSKGRGKPAGKGRSNPSAEERGKKAGEVARKAAKAAGAVGRGVRAAAQAAVCGGDHGGTRENGNRRPGIAGPAAAAGQYIVLRRQKGRVTSYEVCRTLREAEAIARRSLGATIARVESNWE